MINDQVQPIGWCHLEHIGTKEQGSGPEFSKIVVKITKAIFSTFVISPFMSPIMP